MLEHIYSWVEKSNLHLPALRKVFEPQAKCVVGHHLYCSWRVAEGRIEPILDHGCHTDSCACRQERGRVAGLLLLSAFVLWIQATLSHGPSSWTASWSTYCSFFVQEAQTLCSALLCTMLLYTNPLCSTLLYTTPLYSCVRCPNQSLQELTFEYFLIGSA